MHPPSSCNPSAHYNFFPKLNQCGGSARGNDNAMAKRRGAASSRGWLWALTSLWSEHSDERANVPIIDTVLFDAVPVLQGHPYQTTTFWVPSSI